MRLDPYRIAQGFTPTTDEKWRLLTATVISIQSDRTITVRASGSSQDIAGVAYFGHTPPLPNSLVWCASDGNDLFAIGLISADGRTIAPRTSRSTSQTIADATDTAISFDGVNSDLWGMWNVSNAARISCVLPGRYMAIGQVTFAASGTGFRRVWIEKDATSTVGRVDAYPAGAGTSVWINVTSQPFTMAAGEYVRLMVRQNSGGALDVTNSSTYSPSLSLIYLGP